MEEADRLLVDAFFEYEFGELGYSDNERRAVTHGAAVILNAWKNYDRSRSSIGIFSAIAEDEGVKNLTQCNEYQGEIWYNKEQMQRVVLLSALSFAISQKIRDFDADAYVKTLFEKEAVSGYKLRSLLNEEEEEKE